MLGGRPRAIIYTHMSETSSYDGNFLAINELRLDRECLGQAALYFEYSTQLADARSAADDAKNAMEVTSAELDAAIRAKPERYKIEKVTEAAIKAAIPQQEEYQAAQAKYARKKHKADILSAACAALDQRKRMLVLLVDLHGQRYFADPAVAASSSAKSSIEDMGKRETRRLGLPKRDDKKKDDRHDE